jgi:hypothetical protein
VRVKIQHTSLASIITQKKAQITRLKEEIKFLYKQKAFLNSQLYDTHLQVTKEWSNAWTLISNPIHQPLEKLAKRKYQTIVAKLKKLSTSPTKEENKKLQFHPRVVNNTNIQFTEAKLSLLNKGPKYKLHHKPTNWICSLAWEAETAVSLLPDQQQEYMRHRIVHEIEKLYRQEQQAVSTRHTRQYHENT